MSEERREEENIGLRVKAQGEDKPAMNIHEIERVYAGISNPNYGGSGKKGPPIKGGIGGSL